MCAAGPFLRLDHTHGQATSRPSTTRSSETSSAHAAWAIRHLVRNPHPDGLRIGVGMSPSSRIRSRSRACVRPQTHAFHRRDRTTASVGGIRGPGHVDDRGHEIDDVPGLSHEPPPRRDAFWPVCDERRSDSALVHPVLVETERRISGSQPVRWALNLLHHPSGHLRGGWVSSQCRASHRRGAAKSGNSQSRLPDVRPQG